MFFWKLKKLQFPSEISWPLYLCFQTKYPQWLGDIRGRGLVIGLEIVSDAETKAPNSPLAVNIMYNLKAEKVLVGISGKQKNVIFISPPLCFTIENSRRYVKFIYSEKATKFREIFTLLLSYVVPVKSKVKILQNFVAFSEYMNFTKYFHIHY